jgi:inorganic phosphate transporter, PiT family
MRLMDSLLILIVLFGLIFDYTNGFHDAANVVSTVIATRVLRPLAAILMAGILNTLGATQISGVAQTITSGLVDTQSSSQLMIVSALIGAIIWNFLTWRMGIPSSSSYALIGGLVGAAMMEGGGQIIIWDGVINKVLIPMVISPILGFFAAFLLMRALLRFFPLQEKKRFFRHLQLGSAGLIAIAHGLNDAQKSMGIITLGLFAAGMISTTEIPLWVILSCALVMGLGTASGGFRIIRTVGFRLTHIEPMQGFASEISASGVILVASFFGMPLSSTQMVVGSVVGSGSTAGVKAIQWLVVHQLIFAWIVTIPVSGLLAAGANAMLRFFL